MKRLGGCMGFVEVGNSGCDGEGETRGGREGGKR